MGSQLGQAVGQSEPSDSSRGVAQESQGGHVPLPPPAPPTSSLVHTPNYRCSTLHHLPGRDRGRSLYMAVVTTTLHPVLSFRPHETTPHPAPPPWEELIGSQGAGSDWEQAVGGMTWWSRAGCTAVEPHTAPCLLPFSPSPPLPAPCQLWSRSTPCLPTTGCRERKVQKGGIEGGERAWHGVPHCRTGSAPCPMAGSTPQQAAHHTTPLTACPGPWPPDYLCCLQFLCLSVTLQAKPFIILEFFISNVWRWGGGIVDRGVPPFLSWPQYM